MRTRGPDPLAARIRERMNALGLAPEDIARRCEVKPPTVRRWMANMGNQSARYLRPLARALDWTIDELLGEGVPR